MTESEAKKTLKRVFLLYDGEQGYLNDDRKAAQLWADSGKLAIEYAMVGRLVGEHEVTISVRGDA